MAAFFLALAALAAGPAQAEPVLAPLPDGYVAEGQELVEGMYAEVTGLASITDDEDIENLNAACKALNKSIEWHDRENGAKGAIRIYRTSAAVAVIQDTARLWTDPTTCTAGYTIERETTVKTGRLNYKRVAYFQNPNLHCARGRIGRRCEDKMIAGISVTCIDRGDGLIGSIDCVSRQKDLTRGLLVSYDTYIDDGSIPTASWKLTRVDANARIDPVVFQRKE